MTETQTRAAGTATLSVLARHNPFRRLPLPLQLTLRVLFWGVFIGLGVATAYKAPYWLGLVPPDPYSRGEVLKQLPDDLPLPPDLEVVSAGEGQGLPYRIVWWSPQPAAEVAAAFQQAMPAGSWMWAGVEQRPDHMELLRGDSLDNLDHVAKLDIQPDRDGSRLTLEFSPLPVASAPGWRNRAIGGG